MGVTDWFRHEEWGVDTAAGFEAKLAKARPASRAQYLRIQGGTLCQGDDEGCIDAGRRLLLRVLEQYPHDLLEAAGAHAGLGMSYRRAGNYRKAAEHYRACLEIEKGKSFDHGADLALAEVIVSDKEERSFAEAEALLNEASASSRFPFNEQRWRIAVASARLQLLRGDANGAAVRARQALELLKHNSPQLPRHPTVGLIKPEPGTVSEMTSLAASGDAE